MSTRQRLVSVTMPVHASSSSAERCIAVLDGGISFTELLVGELSGERALEGPCDRGLPSGSMLGGRVTEWHPFNAIGGDQREYSVFTRKDRLQDDRRSYVDAFHIRSGLLYVECVYRTVRYGTARKISLVWQ